MVSIINLNIQRGIFMIIFCEPHQLFRHE